MQAFAQDKSGSYAILMGVLSVPLVLAAGFGVDITMANRQQAALQQAMDSAVLAGARYLPSGDKAAIDAANAFFAANATLIGASGTNSYSQSFEVRDGVLHGSVDYKSPTYFMQLANYDAIDLSARSAAGASGGGMELVLVLDVSGSMKSKGKIEALRSASLKLIDTIYGDNATLPNTWVGVAPFSGRVNILDYENGWIEELDPKEKEKGKGKGKGKGRGKGSGKKSQTIAGAAPGCPDLRSEENRQNDAPPDVETFPPFTHDEKVCPGPRALGLTANKAQVRALLSSLYTGHGTSTQEGMAWGFRMLSPKWQGEWGNPNLPLSYADTPRKIAVIMTDGENNPHQAGDDFSRDTSNQMLLETCSLMKANDITIYSIAFDMGNSLTTLYQSCASKPEYHYDALSNAALISAFETIGQEINKGDLRLIY
ncbi:pilus assembly protein [Mesorhizobium sp. YIM 152430]|uniref:TadE/TadG family type IV pilus assembly protein n=1 Tax=Mesorhizobium sp. YIM 152430 TaxID=3031761 RepID=UPI0023DB6ECF|nr:TadE/TadG family type IV pilus assembly protein [Mesorhizobium sp. YIM 152430]MDF1598627.1 pilus assembly protein [Mesorhizobium sp. YIM 152430]